MKTIAKLVLGGLMLAGTAATSVAPANAGVVVGLNVGVPGVQVAYAYPNVCYRPYWARPAFCGYPVYREPIFVGGDWYREPVYYRYYGGERYFWLHNGWMRDRDDFHRGFNRDRDDFHHDFNRDRDWHGDRDQRGDRGDFRR